MTLEKYMQQFADAKMAMSLPDAVKFVRYLLTHECDMNQKLRWGKLSRDMWIREKYIRVVCTELERELRNASPWEDYREIMARLEWPYMYRVSKHILEDRYDGPDGEKWREADAWFVEMWMAYHIVFMRMPGFIPDTTPWKIYEVALYNAARKTAKYRGKQ